MDKFINPRNMSREEFLVRYGMSGNPEMAEHYLADPCDCHMLVCWIACKPDNLLRMITDMNDYREFMESADENDKVWYIVDKEILSHYIVTGMVQ